MDTNLENMKSFLSAMKNEIIGSIKEEILAPKNLVVSLSSRVEQLEKENKLLSARQRENKTDSSLDTPASDSQCSDLVEEIRQREFRKCNVIITGLDEETTGSVAERSERDRNKCEEIFEKLGATHRGIKSVLRLGKKRDDNRRILRATLHNEEDKYELLKLSKNLRHMQKFHKVFVKPDLTPLQRRTDFELRRHLRSMRSEQPEKDFIVFKGKVMEKKDVQNFRNEF